MTHENSDYALPTYPISEMIWMSFCLLLLQEPESSGKFRSLGNSLLKRGKSQWTDAPAFCPSGRWFPRIIHVHAPSCLRRIKPSFLTPHLMLAFTLLTLVCLLPGTISQINCLHPSPCLRLYFHRYEKYHNEFNVRLSTRQKCPKFKPKNLNYLKHDSHQKHT